MAKELLQCRLFSIGRDFTSESFVESVLVGTKFEECIRNGVMEGFMRTREKFQSGDNSLSLMSHCLHEDIYNCIKNELATHMGYEDFYFVPNISGNERLYFSYKGYIFIIKLADSTQNKTHQEQKIRRQEFDSHVISIVYALDKLRESIVSLSLQYIKGQDSLWTRIIPIDYIDERLFDNEDASLEIVPQLPRLKSVAETKEAL